VLARSTCQVLLGHRLYSFADLITPCALPLP
jgi:hypothetical protein